MNKIEYSPAALKDLKQIQSNVESNWGVEVVATVFKKLTSDIRRLEQFPLSGVNLGALIDAPTDYRYIFSEKNYIFYHVYSGKIQIVRVLNERQDFLQHLFRKSFELDQEDIT